MGRWMVRTTAALAICSALGCGSTHAQVVIDMETARLELDDQGGLKGLRFADGGWWPGGGRSFLRIVTARGEARASSVRGDGDRLDVEFSDGSRIGIQTVRGRGFAVLRAVDVQPVGALERLEIARVGVPDDAAVRPILNAAIHEGRAAVVTPGVVNVRTWAGAAEPPQDGASCGARLLGAEVARKHGLEPAVVGIAACSEDALWDVMPNLETAAGLPSPRPEGVWIKKSPWVKESYFFLTRFGESQIEEALTTARRGGFGMVLLGQESWCRSTGRYEINRSNFPDGIEGLKRTVARFREAGFKVGLHVLAASIDADDPYLTPVPDPRLVKGASATLAEDVDAEAVSLPTTAPPADFPEADGGYMGPGTIVQIGDELIRYGVRETGAEAGFLGCARGAYGTRPSPHRKGEVVRHLVRSYGYHMFDMNTTLIDEVAANLARVANACAADMIYFDGSEALQGDHWYYNARLHEAVYRRLDRKDVLIQASSYSPYSWHLIGRMASADGHGDLKGYLDERSPGFDFLASEGMPLDIGWYYGYDPGATIDEYEYVLGATLGYRSSMSFQASLGALRGQAFTPAILDAIRTYDALRRNGLVADPDRFRIDAALGGHRSDPEREALWSRRREWRLNGDSEFEPVVYGPWVVLDGTEARPTFALAEAGRVGFWAHLRGGPWTQAGSAYGDTDATPLESFDGLGGFVAGTSSVPPESLTQAPGMATLSGVSQRLIAEPGAPSGGRCVVFEAVSTRPTADGWTVAGRDLKGPLDLSTCAGLGFWMRGDGRGAQFKVQLLDAAGKAMDFYVPNDYEGWRYQQLSRPAGDVIDWGSVRRLNLYYNGLPAQATVRCAVAGLRALPRLDQAAVVDPWLEIGPHRLAWKGRLAEGEYLAIDPHGVATIYAPGREPRDAGRVEALKVPAGSVDARVGVGSRTGGTLRLRLMGSPDSPPR